MKKLESFGFALLALGLWDWRASISKLIGATEGNQPGIVFEILFDEGTTASEQRAKMANCTLVVGIAAACGLAAAVLILLRWLLLAAAAQANGGHMLEESEVELAIGREDPAQSPDAANPKRIGGTRLRAKGVKLLAWRCGTLSRRMFACAGGAGLSRPVVNWVSLQSILRNSRFTMSFAASQSIVAVALAEVFPGQRMGARRVGGVAGRLATDERFHGRLMDARGLLFAFGLGPILVCCWSDSGLGLNFAIDAVGGKAARATKVGERSAPFTGRPPTQPSSSVTVCVSEFRGRLAAVDCAVLDLGLGLNLALGRVDFAFCFDFYFDLSVTILGLLSCDGRCWGNGSSSRRKVRQVISISLNTGNRFEVSYGGSV